MDNDEPRATPQLYLSPPPANHVKIKKGELIGVAIEVLARILEQQSPATLDASILEAV